MHYRVVSLLATQRSIDGTNRQTRCIRDKGDAMTASFLDGLNEGCYHADAVLLFADGHNCLQTLHEILNLSVFLLNVL